jgi:hypothetical protein
MKVTKYTAAGFLICTLSFGLVLFGTPAPASDVPLAFQGEIMDSICADAASHTDVENAKGITNSRDCVLDCLKDGGKLVLHIPATGVSYGLDTGGPIFDEDRLIEFAGAKVKIIGSLDENSGLIWHIQSIQRV